MPPNRKHGGLYLYTSKGGFHYVGRVNKATALKKRRYRKRR